MVPAENQVPRGFLRAHRVGSRGALRFVPLGRGFLRLEYSDEGVLALVAFVLSRSRAATAIGARLELGLAPAPDADDEATSIAENGLSGVQWRGGRATWGHVYEDDGPAGKGRKLALAAWIDERVAAMANPAPEEIAAVELAEAERRQARQAARIRRAIAAAEKENDALLDLPDRPYSSAAVVAALLDGLRSPAWRVRLFCAEALGHSRMERPRIVAALTALVDSDANASVWEHAAEALGELGATARPAAPVIVRRLESRRAKPHLCVEALVKIGATSPEQAPFFARLIPPCAAQREHSVDVPANAAHAARALARLRRAGVEVDLSRALAPLSGLDPAAPFDVFELVAAGARALLEAESLDAAIAYLRPFVARLRAACADSWRPICEQRLLDGFGRRTKPALDALAAPLGGEAAPGDFPKRSKARRRGGR